MTSVKDEKWLSIEEYLALEEKSQIQHEYVDGRLFAMTGGTQRHATLSSNIWRMLSDHLKGSPCRAYSHNLKVQADERVYYPDVVVTCAKRDDDSLFAQEPVLIVEVLSPSTGSTDRRVD